MESVICPSKIHDIDERARIFGWSPDERSQLMQSVEISDSVPEHVHRLLVTSKNLIIFSCYYYPFNVTAVQTAFAALEMAIRLRAEAEQLPVRLKGLKDAMDLAVRLSWISDDGLPVPNVPRAIHIASDGEVEEEEAGPLKPYVEVLAEFMPKIRNQLAHGSGFMSNHGASNVLMIGSLINQLFPTTAP
jgi:hypothetical protein